LSKFDIFVLAMLAISAAVGFARGAVREIAAMVALVAAASLTIFGLPYSTPLAAKIVHTHWLAAALALVAVFVITYGALRLTGAALARRIQQTDLLGVLDRTVGLLIGLIRGLVVLGALYLMFNAAVQPDRQPGWIVEAQTWPLARTMGHVLEALAPKGLDLAGRVKPAFDRAIHDSSGDRPAADGYDARERGDIDDLVEKSR
jgi:membrane protein required for colicin V production